MKSFKDLYASVSFEISGKKPGEYLTKKGGAMIYGITIPQNTKSPKNPEGAVAFVKFILSPQGQEIMKKNGQGVINPHCITGDSTILKR